MGETDRFQNRPARALVEKLSGTQRRYERARAFRHRLLFGALAGLLSWGDLLMTLFDAHPGALTSFIPWIGWLLMFLPNRWTPISLAGQIATLAAVGALIDGALARPLWWWTLLLGAWVVQGVGYLRHRRESVGASRAVRGA